MDESYMIDASQKYKKSEAINPSKPSTGNENMHMDDKALFKIPLSRAPLKDSTNDLSNTSDMNSSNQSISSSRFEFKSLKKLGTFKLPISTPKIQGKFFRSKSKAAVDWFDRKSTHVKSEIGETKPALYPNKTKVTRSYSMTRLDRIKDSIHKIRKLKDKIQGEDMTLKMFPFDLAQVVEDESDDGRLTTENEIWIDGPPTLRPSKRNSRRMEGQLKLSVYINYGLLTVHVKQGRHLTSTIKTSCNTYVKLALVPDDNHRTKCKTQIVEGTNQPKFDEKFSFELLKEDLSKRLLISVWNKTNEEQCDFLGCTSFGINSIEQTNKVINGWYYLLTEDIGRRKHLQVVSQRHRSEEEQSSGEERKITPVNKDVTWMETHVLLIRRGENGFGFSVSGSSPVQICRVSPDCSAYTAGLRSDDFIVRINGQNVSRSSSESVARIIRYCQKQAILEVQRPKPAPASLPDSGGARLETPSTDIPVSIMPPRPNQQYSMYPHYATSKRGASTHRKYVDVRGYDSIFDETLPKYPLTSTTYAQVADDRENIPPAPRLHLPLTPRRNKTKRHPSRHASHAKKTLMRQGYGFVVDTDDSSTDDDNRPLSLEDLCDGDHASSFVDSNTAPTSYGKRGW